ncbi:MAG: peptide chain release factor N(5)-glutamine methyltransferase [Pyrinomonadaceae bacterium]|nr:peptide chain release factor N(5)-glutamine methyltransferase [Pyrinomonadaceae bacterium]
MLKISEVLKDTTDILQQSGIVEPRREAVSLLAFYLGKDKTFLIAHPEYELTEEDEFSFYQLVSDRANRTPFQYITGTQEFYGLDFEVNEDVLIPRPETEIIVENAIEILQKIENPNFCEVGTGSGCISVSILHNVPKANAIGLDISSNALGITRKNAGNYNLLNRLELRKSDVFSALSQTKFDLIVSNPPYIPSEDIAHLQAEVRDFEPLNALTDGKNGLTIIEKIINQSPEFLHPNGFLLMEIGFNQSEDVQKMFSDEIWQSVEILPDLQGIPRTVKAKVKGKR